MRTRMGATRHAHHTHNEHRIGWAALLTGAFMLAEVGGVPAGYRFPDLSGALTA